MGTEAMSTDMTSATILRREIDGYQRRIAGDNDLGLTAVAHRLKRAARKLGR